MKHVVIVGGGFAGLNCARKLASHPGVRITLIDRNSYQQFQPLLYQVATAALAPINAAFALRNVLRRHPDVDVKMAEVVSADLRTRTVETADGLKYQGDFLVLAAGSQVNFFETPGADKYACPLYSLQNAETLRSRILEALEASDRDPSLIAKGELNFVVVGAGPTGVETAGMLGDMMQRRLNGEYRDLDLSKAQVFVVDMGKSVLSTFSPQSQAYAAKMLKKLGVQLRLEVAVKEITAHGALLSDGTEIASRTVIWAGGLKASSLAGNLGIKHGHGGRIDVKPDFSVEGFPGVYALGDFANISGKDGKPLPQLAAVAEQAGKYCAKHIAATLSGESVKPFDYLDKGIMAMIGRNTAVAEVGEHRHELTGPIAFAAWLGVHAVLLTTARAKVEAFVEWAWDYFGNSQVDQILDRPTPADWGDNNGDDDMKGAK